MSKRNEVLISAFYAGYQVNTDGSVTSSIGNILKLKLNTSGNYKYYSFSYRFNNKTESVKVHRLQAYQKFGPKMFERGIQVRHLNGKPLDNSFDNIAIGTVSENQMDISEDSRMKRALHATSSNRVYNVKDVREFYKLEKSYTKTMEQFKISSKGTLHYILNKALEI